MDGLTETPKTDFYLKLASKNDMPTVLSSFYTQDYSTVVSPETGEILVEVIGSPYLVPNTPDYEIDVVGTIWKPTGVMLADADGNEYPKMKALDGWHINIRLNGDARRADVEALSAYFVDPEPHTPSRVWL